MRRFLDRLYLLAGAAAALLVLLIAVLMIGQSVLREFHVRTGAVNDVVAWFCAAASFFAMAHAFKHGDFVRVTLLLEAVSPKMRRVLDVSCLLVAAVSVAYLTYWATSFTYESYEFAEMATGLVVIPIWIPQSTFVIGCWLLLIAMIDELVGVVRGDKPSYQRAIEERHAAGDFSSDV